MGQQKARRSWQQTLGTGLAVVGGGLVVAGRVDGGVVGVLAGVVDGGLVEVWGGLELLPGLPDVVGGAADVVGGADDVLDGPVPARWPCAAQQPRHPGTVLGLQGTPAQVWLSSHHTLYICGEYMSVLTRVLQAQE